MSKTTIARICKKYLEFTLNKAKTDNYKRFTQEAINGRLWALNRLRDILTPSVNLVQSDEVNISLDKTRQKITILPKYRRAYVTSAATGKSFSLFVQVSNSYGVLGCSFTYDTNDRWMFLRHFRDYLSHYCAEDSEYLKNTWHYFDQVSLKVFRVPVIKQQHRNCFMKRIRWKLYWVHHIR